MSSNNIGDPGHGHSPAAWTSVAIMLLAIAIGTASLYFGWIPVLWVAVALLIIGMLTGFVMAKLGFGVRGPRWTPKAHD